MIKVSNDTRIIVIGDIHEHEYQFDCMIEAIQPSSSTLVVSVGDIYDKGLGVRYAESITDKIRNLVEQGFAYIIRGNHELKLIRAAKQNNLMTNQLTWLDTQPLVLTFEFPNTTRLTVLHGGVKPSMDWEDLHDVEVCFINDLDRHGNMVKRGNGKSWHEIYDGRFGYIIAGHAALKDGQPKFYDFSCNIDTACYVTGILSAQEFTSKGLGVSYSIAGPHHSPSPVMK